MPLSSTSPDNLPPRLSFRVPPEPSHLLRARERLRDYLRQYCASPEAIDDCVLCVEEACTNAIRHSGAADEIEISLAFEAERLVAQVRDRGRGFDTASFDPSRNPDPSADHGRGLFIIAALMDSLELRLDGGLEVRMARAAEPRCEPQPLESGLGVARAADTLGHREARTRAMLEEIDEAFFALDWEYRYVHANQAALRITGKPLEELLGRTPWEAFPQLEGSLLEEHYRQAMELGAPSVFEHRSVVTDDWLEIRIYPTSAGVSAYYREINERKQVEQELQRSRERERMLAEVVEKADVPFAIREPDGRLVLFNQAFAELTGYSREELEEGASTLAVELTPPDWWETETPLLAQAVAERRPVRFEKEYIRKDGSRVPIEVFAQPVFDDTGDLVHYRSFVTDITARKQAAETLRESEERFRSLFESMTEGVVLHEVVYEEGRAVDYRILDVNPSFESQTGVTAQSARGRLASELYGTGEAPYLAEYAQVAEDGRPYSFETYFEPMDRHFRITATSPARGRFATVFEDISERKLVDQERQRLLEASQAMAEALQSQGEELQSQNEELQVQSEELHVQTDELRAHSTDLAERSRLAEALNDIGGFVHSTLDFDDITQRALERGVQTLGVDAGAIEMRDGPGWIVRYQCGFAAADVGLRLSREEAPCASLAERRRETLAIADMTTDETINVGFVKSHALKSVLAAPLIVRDVVVGCLLFYGRQARAFDEAETDFGRKLGVTASLAVENARLIEDEREATRLGTTLNEINRLIHGTLDADEIMQRVVAEAVEAVQADSAMIAIKLGDDWVAEYGYPAVPGVIHESVSTDEVPFVLTAATTRLPVAIDDCASDPRCIPEVQGRFGVRSVLCIPLIVRDEVIGVVFFNHHTEAVKFEPRTVDFAGKLAAAISAALENAQLYAAQQRIAVTLQENFIHPLPQIPGLELASVSATAFQPDLVGGDFADAFRLPDGRVALLIGDVMGKGIKAAGLTETARTAVRAVALTTPSADDILPNVNRVLIRETDQLVTVLLALLDIRTGEAFLSSAGHPPPVHLSAAGATLVETGFGPPLGALEYPYKVGRVHLAPGDALVLYTDGVTEARRRGEFFGEAGLLAALRSVEDRRPQLLVDTLRDAVADFADRLTDDLHVLALRLSR